MPHKVRSTYGFGAASAGGSLHERLEFGIEVTSRLGLRLGRAPASATSSSSAAAAAASV